MIVLSNLRWRWKLIFLCQTCSYIGSMTNSIGEKKVIKIDVSSDTVCPWCFVGKQNLQKAMDSAKDQFDFEVFFILPSWIHVSFLQLPTFDYFWCFLSMFHVFSHHQVRWHPFFLNPNAPKEGVRKTDFYKQKFGPAQYEGIISRMTKVILQLLCLDFSCLYDQSICMALEFLCCRYFKALDFSMILLGWRKWIRQFWTC